MEKILFYRIFTQLGHIYYGKSWMFFNSSIVYKLKRLNKKICNAKVRCSRNFLLTQKSESRTAIIFFTQLGRLICRNWITFAM